MNENTLFFLSDIEMLVSVILVLLKNKLIIRIWIQNELQRECKELHSDVLHESYNTKHITGICAT
jgi:hypothetical protein